MPTAKYRALGCRRTMRALLTLAVTLGLLGFPRAKGVCAPPTLNYLSPAGGQRGSRVATTCEGEFSWPVQVWAPGVTVCVGEEKGKLEVTIPDDLPANRVWIRLFNDEGSSAAVPFLIGSVKEIVEEEPNDSPENAPAITVQSVTINGVLHKKDDVDSFAVQLTAGQTLVAAVDAHSRLGSPMDAILQIVSPDGRALAENHDRLGLDPGLTFAAPETGTFVVRVFAFPAEPDTTVAFQGGANYIYRLTLTTGPFITHALPFTASLTDASPVELLGWNIPAETKLPVVPWGGTALADQQEFEAAADPRTCPDSRLGIVFAPSMAGDALVRLVPDKVVVATATGDANQAATVSIPTALAGWLRKPRQTNTYRMTLQKGQHVVIAAESQSLGLPTVPTLRLIDPTGAVVVEVPKKGPEQDAVITHTAAHDGDYQLIVADRYAHGGDRYLYRLTVRLDEADFTLSLDTDAIVVNAQKPMELPITVQRRAVADETVGPITIEAVDLPAGVAAESVMSEPQGESAEKVTMTLTTTGPAFSGPIRIRGTAQQPRTLARFARTPARLGARFETLWLTAIPPTPAETAADAK